MSSCSDVINSLSQIATTTATQFTIIFVKTAKLFVNVSWSIQLVGKWIWFKTKNLINSYIDSIYRLIQLLVDWVCMCVCVCIHVDAFVCFSVLSFIRQTSIERNTHFFNIKTSNWFANGEDIAFDAAFCHWHIKWTKICLNYT